MFHVTMYTVLIEARRENRMNVITIALLMFIFHITSTAEIKSEQKY